MVKSYKSSARRSWMLAFAVATLVGSASQARASLAGSAPHSPDTGQAFETSRGPDFITGSIGSMQTTTLPGRAGQGFLLNNGNGTSTLLVPGGVPQVISTPR